MTQTVTTDQDTNQLDMHDSEEVPIPPHIKYLPVTDVANPSDPPRDQQEQSNESNHTPIHETKSSLEPQRKYEASQASNEKDNCQDTLLTIKNEILPAAQSFNQLGNSNGGVFQNPTTQEVDESNFIHKGKQS